MNTNSTTSMKNYGSMSFTGSRLIPSLWPEDVKYKKPEIMPQISPKRVLSPGPRYNLQPPLVLDSNKNQVMDMYTVKDIQFLKAPKLVQGKE